MNTPKHDQQTHDQIAQDLSEFGRADPTAGMGDQNINAAAATVAVVGVGAPVFEAVLIPGIALGVAAMLLPRFMPQIGSAVDPLVRGAYRVGRKTRELIAEAEAYVRDLVAEVNAEEADDPRERARRDGLQVDASQQNSPTVNSRTALTHFRAGLATAAPHFMKSSAA